MSSKLVSNVHNKWFVLCGSVAIQLSVSTLFMFGNGSPYIASYMVMASESPHILYREFLSSCNWVFAAKYIAFIVSSLLGAHIQQQIGARLSLFLSALLMCGATVFCHFILSNMYALIFVSLLFGCGAGIAYPISFVSCLQRFRHTYVVIVFLNACLTAGPALFIPLQSTHVINPRNIAIDRRLGLQDAEVMQRVSVWFLYLALIIAVLQCAAILLIGSPPAKTPEEHGGAIFYSDNTVAPHSCDCHKQSTKAKYIAYYSIYDIRYPQQQDCAIHQMRPIAIIFSVKFWQLWMMHFVSMLLFFFMVLNVKNFAVECVHIVDDQYLSTVASVAFACSGVARFVWWRVYVASKQSMRAKKIILFVLNAIGCVFTASLSLCGESVTTAVRHAMYAVWMCVIFCVLNCHWVLYPSLLAITFGHKYSGSMMGYMCLADVPAMILVIVLCAHADSTDSWQACPLIIAACLIFGIILIVVWDPSKVIAERQLKDTMKSFSIQFPTYESIASFESAERRRSDYRHESDRTCQCGVDCQCANCSQCQRAKA